MGGGWDEEGYEGDGCLPWPVSPRTIMAKRACTARSAMMIVSSILGGCGEREREKDAVCRFVCRCSDYFVVKRCSQ